MLAGVLTTHAAVERPAGGEWEYVIWAIGVGRLKGTR